MPAGRPTKYRPEYVKEVYKLAKNGLTDKAIAEFFDVNETTIHGWKEKFPEFYQSLKDGKKQHDDSLVEASLLHRARGYSHQSEKIFLTKEGEVVRVPTVEHYPPDPTSMIFWLKNRQPKEWRDKVEAELSGKVDLVSQVVIKRKGD